MTERIQNFKFYYPPGYKQADDADQQQQQQQSFVLVLIHGLNGNLLTWTPNLAPKLAAATGMRIVTFDQPCYGQNPLPFKQMEELEVEEEEEEEEEEENENDDKNQKQTQEADPIQDMITKLDSIMTPSNLAVELFKFLQAVKVIPTIAEQQEQQQEQEQQSSPIKQLKKQIKRPFIHVLGQSFGGKTAIAFADKYPFLVASLTLGDIGICPCNKYDHKTAHELAAQFFLRHIESFPDEESVKNLHSNKNINDGGDDVGKKYTFDTKTQSWVTLVRPHVGFIHDYHSRKADLRDAWMDFEGPVMAIRAGDEYTCLSDQEWRLMKDLRRQAQPEVHAELDCFVTPSSEGFHGVYRSHEDLFVNVYSEFVKKTSS